MALEGNAAASSLFTEDDYSFINGPQTGSLFHSGFPCRQDLSAETADVNISPIENGCIAQSEHALISRHALETAYEHMKRRLAETEFMNRSLMERLKPQTNSNALDGDSASQSMSANEVTKAWEAYSDKCRECEKLRDDLRVAEQKAAKAQNAVRSQTHKEDMMRVQSLNGDLKKKLQQTELEIRDHRSKAEMAREELQKEKEFHEMVLRSAEEKHHEMQNTITLLQQDLKDKVHLNQQLIKDMNHQQQLTQDLLKKKDAELKEKMDEMEAKILKEQEERSHLETQVIELEQWKEMMQYNISSGVPLNVAPLQPLKVDENDNDTNSEIDPGELIIELHSLTEELVALKEKTQMQSVMLSQLCDDPRIQESLSLNCSAFSDADVQDGRPLVPNNKTSIVTEVTSASISNTNSRQEIDNPPVSFFTSAPSDVPAKITPLAVSRQIHAVETSSLVSPDRRSPQKIDIPSSENLIGAFQNLCVARSADHLQPMTVPETEENFSVYYTTVMDADHLDTLVTRPANRSIHSFSSGSDSGTETSNPETLMDSNLPSGNYEANNKRPSAVVNNDMRLPLRYHPTYDVNSPTGVHQASWPTSERNLPEANLTPLWPPNVEGTDLDASSNYDQLLGGRDARKESSRLHEREQTVREFEVQQPIRPISREPFPSAASLPPAHPSSRPANRARTSDNSQVSSSAVVAPRRRADRTGVSTSLDTERAFLPPLERSPRVCPVCDEIFSDTATASFLQRHINGHFSEEEDDGYDLS